MPELVASKNNKVFFRVALPQKIFKIGRATDNDLTLPDKDISRQHAEIYFAAENFHIKDLSSSATTLNSKQIEASQLTDQDQIGIGTWTLTFSATTELEEERDEEVKTSITQIEDVGATKIVKMDAVEDNLIVETPYLIIKQEGENDRIEKLTQQTTTIGSREGCDIVIANDYVSGRHASLTKTNDSMTIEDLESTNGTFIGGARVERLALNQKTEIKLGPISMELGWESESQSLEPSPTEKFCGIVGKSTAIRSLFAKIQKIAPSDHTVLVHGETGCGKELIARAIHDLSHRKEGPYTIINCGAISANLIESELFGHEKGAFTGAQARHLGAFEQANKGTLFLDEIGELPIDLQPKILRVLENRTIRRVGGTTDIPIDVRIVAATHRNLNERVAQGHFRQDLYFRLYVIPLLIPPLRDRIEDIALIAEHFINQASVEAPKKLSEDAIEKLTQYPWPGNVRELKNVMLRSLIFASQNQITADDIELMDVFTQPPTEEKLNLNSVEKNKIEQALKESDGNKKRAAEKLGIAKSTLFKKLKDHNIQG